MLDSLLVRLRLAALDDRGQTMAEYAVILAVITLVVVVAVTALSGGIADAIDSVTKIFGDDAGG